MTLTVTDMHTAGEPVRIITGGIPELAGARLLDKRRDALDRHDQVRRRLMLEPRGHGGMYGVIPLPPCDPAAALSVLFTHAGGYSTMCGHATIAIGRWAIDSGRVVRTGDMTRFGLECPCGVVQVSAHSDGRVSFESVPAFVDALDVAVATAGGTVRVDVAYGGAYYAILPASRLGLDWDEAGHAALLTAASALFDAARAQIMIGDAPDPDLAFLYGVILTDDAPWPQPTRNLCVFGDGQFDRSPTGSGVTARLALDTLARGAALDAPRTFTGPTGQSFTGSAIKRSNVGGRDSVVALIEGRAFYTGETRFSIEADDPLADGFLLAGNAG